MMVSAIIGFSILRCVSSRFWPRGFCLLLKCGLSVDADCYSTFANAGKLIGRLN